MKTLYQVSVNAFLATLLFLFGSATVAAQEIEQSPAGSTSTQKGQMLISTTFSVKHSESENESRLFQNLDESYRLDWNVTLRSGYFIKENFAVGGLFKYSNNLDRLEYTNDLGDVFDNTQGRTYSIAPFIRNYLPLGNGTFYLFNETNLEFSYGREVRQIEDADDINRIVRDTYELKLGIQPGISAFITDLVAVEVGTSVLGLSSKYTQIVENGDEENEGYKFENEVSFEIDLLSLFLGITFYFPVK
jgi:hypothetical protein